MAVEVAVALAATIEAAAMDAMIASLVNIVVLLCLLCLLIIFYLNKSEVFANYPIKCCPEILSSALRYTFLSLRCTFSLLRCTFD